MYVNGPATAPKALQTFALEFFFFNRVPNMSLSEFDEIRTKKNNRFTYILVIGAGIGMLFIGQTDYFHNSGQELSVNGQEVAYEQFQHQRNELQKQQPNLNNRALSQQTVALLVRQLSLQQHALASPYQLPDEELYKLISGRYGNKEEYQQALAAMRTNARSFENSVRNEEKVSSYYTVLASGSSKDPALEQFLQAFAQQRSYEALRLDMRQAMAQLNPSDEELQKFLSDNQQNYMRPEQVDLSYVFIAPPQGSWGRIRNLYLDEAAKKAEEDKIYELSAAAMEKINNGATLAEVAQLAGATVKEEKGVSATVVHPLFSQKASLDAMFGENKLGEGKISDPLSMKGGSLFFVIDRRMASAPMTFGDELRERLTADYRAATAKKQLQERAEEFKKELQGGKSLAELAAQHNLTVESWEKLNRYSPSDKLDPAAMNELFSDGAKVSSTVASNGDVLVTQLTKVESGDPQAIPEALRESFTGLWQNEQNNRALEAFGNQLAQQAKVKVGRALLGEDEQ